MSQKPYLIVGQGLAGTVLALRFCQCEIPFQIVDNGHETASSMVAAGMWNPMVFRKLNKTWNIDDFLPQMHAFFEHWEHKLSAKWRQDLPIARVFNDYGEMNDWMARAADESYSQYLGEVSNRVIEGINHPLGYGVVHKSGFLKVPEFLKNARIYLEKLRALIQGQFNHGVLMRDGQNWSYQEQEYAGVIFCEGFKNDQNPWFSYLPMRNTKGELLDIKAEGLSRSYIPNNGVWVLPYSDDMFKVGATFAWKDLNMQVSSEARDKLNSEANQLLGVPLQEVKQSAGIRPTSADRRPLLGEHPEYKGLYIFNGLGPKGVLMAPALSTIFTRFLNKEIELPPDIDIKRFRYAKG